MGGAAEPPSTMAVFDAAFEAMGKVLKNSGYHSQVVYGGEHAQSKKLVERYFPGLRKDLNASNLNDALNTLRADIRAGRIKEGDQLLVVNMNHGQPRAPGVKSHEVNLNQGTFNMDDLIDLRNEAEKAGVKLAIIDQSCYSGSSIPLGTPKTCVTSITGADYVGHTSEIRDFWLASRRGKSIEETFLDARKKRHMPTAARISGAPGDKTYELLKGAQKHLLNYASEVHKKLRKWEGCYSCFHPDPETVAGTLNLREIAAQAAIPGKDLSKLKTAVEDHARIYRKLESVWQVERSLAQKTVVIAGRKWKWDHLATFDLLGETKMYQELLAKEKRPGWQAHYRRMLKILPEVGKKSIELANSDKRFASIPNLSRQIVEHTEALRRAAGAVKVAEGEIYDALYRNLRGERPNPCADFVL